MRIPKLQRFNMFALGRHGMTPSEKGEWVRASDALELLQALEGKEMKKPSEPRQHKVYLGDSVYVEIENGMVKLTTDNGYPDDPRNVIYMEPGVIENFLRWLKQRGFHLILL